MSDVNNVLQRYKKIYKILILELAKTCRRNGFVKIIFTETMM